MKKETISTVLGFEPGSFNCRSTALPTCVKHPVNTQLLRNCYMTVLYKFLHASVAVTEQEPLWNRYVLSLRHLCEIFRELLCNNYLTTVSVHWTGVRHFLLHRKTSLYTQKKDLIESKKIICLKDFL